MFYVYKFYLLETNIPEFKEIIIYIWIKSEMLFSLSKMIPLEFIAFHHNVASLVFA